MEVLQGNFLVMGTALLVGLAFGFVLQRGRYCVNTAFRDIIFINDFTLFRAYLLSLVIAIVGANLIEDMGWLGGYTDPDTEEYVAHTLRRQAFAPIANMVGGYIFGLGIVLAGGCGSGILYRVGEGLVASIFAVLGFGLGIMTTTTGVLQPVYRALRAYRVDIGEVGDPALWDLFGGGPGAKWATIAVLVILMAVFVFKGKPFEKGPAKGYKWSVAGLLVGVIAVIAWWASAQYGASPRGLSFTGPMGEFFRALTVRDSGSQDSMFNFWGLFTSTWSAMYILTVPVGAYLSAKALGEFKLKSPGAGELMVVFGGAWLMGFGASVAGGCNIGHGLTGMSTLAISSIVATAFTLLGNWTMVYFKFIKPMQD